MASKYEMSESGLDNTANRNQLAANRTGIRWPESNESHLIGAAQLISFMTLAELELWAAWRKWGKRKREAVDAYLKRYTVVFPDRDLCKKWAEGRPRAGRTGSSSRPPMLG